MGPREMSREMRGGGGQKGRMKKRTGRVGQEARIEPESVKIESELQWRPLRLHVKDLVRCVLREAQNAPHELALQTFQLERDRALPRGVDRVRGGQKASRP
jgi:hypothetical protein